VWHQAKNDLKIQYQPQAEGVAAGVLLTPWSIGYSSIGEAKLNKLPIPKFRQNDRQKTPVAAGKIPCATSNGGERVAAIMMAFSLPVANMLSSTSHRFYQPCHA
jgi:hypothetical protein